MPEIDENYILKLGCSPGSIEASITYALTEGYVPGSSDYPTNTTKTTILPSEELFGCQVLNPRS